MEDWHPSELWRDLGEENNRSGDKKGPAPGGTSSGRNSPSPRGLGIPSLSWLLKDHALGRHQEQPTSFVQEIPSSSNPTRRPTRTNHPRPILCRAIGANAQPAQNEKGAAGSRQRYYSPTGTKKTCPRDRQSTPTNIRVHGKHARRARNPPIQAGPFRRILEDHCRRIGPVEFLLCNARPTGRANSYCYTIRLANGLDRERPVFLHSD
jgi:hypothetical protein